MAVIAALLNAAVILDCDSVAIGIYNHPFPPPPYTHPRSPSLMNLTVSVDVKHHVYLLQLQMMLI